MQEEVVSKSVAFIMKIEKMTEDALKTAIRHYLSELQRPRSPKAPKTYRGKQTVKQLTQQGHGAVNIEITGKNIKGFDKVARKYGVDYALKKDITTSPPKYLVFFKAADTAVLNAAFAEFTAKVVKKTKKPSIRKKLENFKRMVEKPQKNTERNKSRGAR